MTLIEAKNISLSYENGTVVRDLSFSVEKGDYLCVVGENGSGKSTLVKAILGLKKINSGELIFGEGLSGNEIGYLPQQTEIQRDFPASVYEVVLSGCQNSRKWRPFYNKEEKKRAGECMAKLGIDKIGKKTYRNLSGGQQQRVLLARALCATKKIILMDEPTAGLDPIITQEFYALTKSLHNEGITIIMVSHDIPMAVKNATKILHLHHGSLFFGNVSDYIESDAGKIFTEVLRNSKNKENEGVD